MGGLAPRDRARVLFVCGRGLFRDGVFPIGLIGAANAVDAPKQGRFYFDLDDRAIADAEVVVLHLHWDWNYLYLDPLIQRIRRVRADAQIVVGGYLATVHAARLLSQHGIDYCVVRDFERPFPELIAALLERRPRAWILEHVANVVCAGGTSRRTYTPTPEDLASLDTFTLSWFPALQKYVLFQDAFNCLEGRKWEEEQYYPSLIIKGSFHRECSFCILSNKNQRGYCEPTRWVYPTAQHVVDFFERAAPFRGATIFGDFAALDLAEVLRLLRGKRYDYYLTIGDLFRRLPPSQVITLSRHFRRVALSYRLLDPRHYTGRAPITASLFDRRRDRYLFRRLAQASVRNLTVRYWVRKANLVWSRGFAPYKERLNFVDPWVPFPAQNPSAQSFQRLTANVEDCDVATLPSALEYEVEVAPAPRAVRGFHLTLDPFTAKGEDVPASPAAHRGAATPDELGVLRFSIPLTPGARGLRVRAAMRFLKADLRTFELLVPPGGAVVLRVAFGDNLGIASIDDARRGPLWRDLLYYTVVPWGTTLRAVELRRVRREVARVQPALEAIRI